MAARRCLATGAALRPSMSPPPDLGIVVKIKERQPPASLVPSGFPYFCSKVQPTTYGNLKGNSGDIPGDSRSRAALFSLTF